MDSKKRSWKVSELYGSDVYDLSGKFLGKLSDVLPSGANDIWVVKDPAVPEKEILIPALVSTVREVDVKSKKIVVDLPQGLKEIYEG